MAQQLSVLVVDDEYAVRESLVVWLKKSGYKVAGAGSGEEALDKIEQTPFDFVLLDIKMPEMDGIEALRRIKDGFPTTLVVMMTAYASVESAVDAMKLGASDYLIKPLDPDLLDPLITRLLRLRELIEENTVLRERLYKMSRFENFVGQSDAIQTVFQMIRDVALTGSSVLITGETGTGKEVVAKTIHAVSTRRDAPFVPINCGAFPEQLLESELFGHERGAFTGAHQVKRGRLELCRGGTLFLDEIADISPRMQVDLLRVLEEKRFYRVGGENPIEVDFRVIAATNRDLKRATQTGTFRSDLYYRLNVISIEVPPLRERKGDVALLTQYFIDRFSKETKKNVDSVSREALAFLNGYQWPGNVRELQNAVERAVVLCKKRRIGLEDLAFLRSCPPEVSPDLTLDQVVRDHIERVLKANDGNISKSAETLGIHRSTLHKRIKEYGIAVGIPPASRGPA